MSTFPGRPPGHDARPGHAVGSMLERDGEKYPGTHDGLWAKGYTVDRLCFALARIFLLR